MRKQMKPKKSCTSNSASQILLLYYSAERQREGNIHLQLKQHSTVHITNTHWDLYPFRLAKFQTIAIKLNKKG